MAVIGQDFDNCDALALADLVRRKEVKPVELVETVIERIERVNPSLNCVNIKTYELARKLAEGPLPQGPFMGVPFLLKDLILLYSGVKTTNACAYYRDFVARDDSVIVQRIKQSGLILVGKTNAPEWGFNITTEPRLYGPTRNPWNLAHVAGGSSGGSGAAVASRIVPLADASDGGGSIRIPASNNGIVGLKPSRGRVTLAPHFGDFWYGQAIMNCLSLTVRDTAAYLDVIAGPVPGDPYQPATPVRPFLEEVHADPGRLKIGYTTHTRIDMQTTPECVRAVEETAKLCSELGHVVVEMKFSFNFDQLMQTFVRTAAVLGAMGLLVAEGLIGRPPTREDFEGASWALAQRGKSVDGVQHAMDIEVMRHFSRQIARDCEPFDAVLTPTMPMPPAKLGTYDQTNEDLDAFLAMIAPGVIFTIPFNVSGQPAISLPLSWTDDGLPIGVQFAARYAQEATLLRLAGQMEKARPWIQRRPPVCGS